VWLQQTLHTDQWNDEWERHAVSFHNCHCHDGAHFPSNLAAMRQSVTTAQPIPAMGLMRRIDLVKRGDKIKATAASF